jgi:light-regulated signal transduction histidine kinase (bacteriophytochrome)
MQLAYRDALQKAGSATEQLQQFVYAASHDLQEPLRAIVAYAQLLDRQFENDPATREYTQFLLGGALRMRELLQHLLVYSRAGSSKRRQLINLNVPLQMALLKLAPDIRSTTAHIAHHPLPEAIGDENEIAQVFEYILSNSLKFRSAAPPQIVITAEQGSGVCTVSLRDNGIGIEPRFCEQVLLPFKRLQDNTIPGSGLGLAICHKILQAHNGQIKVESDGEHGSTVSFSLPT